MARHGTSGLEAAQQSATVSRNQPQSGTDPQSDQRACASHPGGEGEGAAAVPRAVVHIREWGYPKLSLAPHMEASAAVRRLPVDGLQPELSASREGRLGAAEHGRWAHLVTDAHRVRAGGAGCQV